MKLLNQFATLAAALALIGAGSVRAQDSGGENAVAEARLHVNKAKVHYDLGEYQQAAEEYTLVYRIRPVPALLFNIAQAYRQAGMHEKARQFYRTFLRESPDQKNRPMIERALKEIDELLAREKRAKEIGPNGVTAEPSHPTDELALPRAAAGPPVAASKPPVAAQAQAAAEPIKAAPPRVAKPPDVQLAMATTRPAPVAVTSSSAVPVVEQSTPIYKKWWFWTAAGAVVVGGGAAFAASRPPPGPPATHFGNTPVF